MIGADEPRLARPGPRRMESRRDDAEIDRGRVPTVEVESGKRLVLAIEQDAHVDVLHACGGNARCTTCRVEFIDGEPASIDRRRTRGPGRQGRDRRAAIVPDRLRSRHDGAGHLAPDRQRTARSRPNAAAGHHAAASVDLPSGNEKLRTPSPASSHPHRTIPPPPPTPLPFPPTRPDTARGSGESR